MFRLVAKTLCKKKVIRHSKSSRSSLSKHISVQHKDTKLISSKTNAALDLKGKKDKYKKMLHYTLNFFTVMSCHVDTPNIK